MPPQLAPFDATKQQLHSELPLDVRAPHRLSKAQKHLQLMTAGEGRCSDDLCFLLEKC